MPSVHLICARGYAKANVSRPDLTLVLDTFGVRIALELTGIPRDAREALAIELEDAADMLRRRG